MKVHLVAPSDMEVTSAVVVPDKNTLTVEPLSRFKSVTPLIAGYVRVEGSAGAERKYAILVNPGDGAITVAEEVPAPVGFDKLSAEEAKKKATNTGGTKKKK